MNLPNTYSNCKEVSYMDQQMSNFNQLDQFINWVIQMNGIAYVIDNYIALRDQYYSMKMA